MSEGWLSPKAPYYAAIEPSITRYPYDTRRAQQFLEEIGLQKGADGFSNLCDPLNWH